VGIFLYLYILPVFSWKVEDVIVQENTGRCIVSYQKLSHKVASHPDEVNCNVVNINDKSKHGDNP